LLSLTIFGSHFLV